MSQSSRNYDYWNTIIEHQFALVSYWLCENKFHFCDSLQLQQSTFLLLIKQMGKYWIVRSPDCRFMHGKGGRNYTLCFCCYQQ